jgi:hypothetical protein
MNPVFAILVTERFADPIVSLPPDAFRKREPVHLRSAITGKIGSPVTIRQPQPVLFVCSEMIELREELVDSYLYQVHLGHELEPNDYDRSFETTMYI